MKVLDATYLIDYLDGDEATEAFYEANGGADERWVMPVPAFAEVLVGEGDVPNGDVAGARADLARGETYAVDERSVVMEADTAAEIAPGGPCLDGPDALVAAVGRELDTPVVSSDGGLTHPDTKQVVDVEEYR